MTGAAAVAALGNLDSSNNKTAQPLTICAKLFCSTLSRE
jgi:hypothetical protein